MSFIEQIGIQHPIIQAPMAGVSTPAMAATVSNAGGLGSIGIGAADISTARNMIEEVRHLTDKPFNVNVFTHKPAQTKPQIEEKWIEELRPIFKSFGASPPSVLHEIYKSFIHDQEMIELVAELAPPVVSFHFGLPSTSTIQKLKNAGCVLFSTATNPDEAKDAVDRGVDAIVAQGYEAGGHRGMFDPDVPDDCLSTMDLTQLLVRDLNVPVIAAGGIMDGHAARKFLDRGAAAVQLGTAFIACPESSADQAYRDALSVAPQDNATAMTRVISGRPARCLHNHFTRWGRDKSATLIPDYPRAYDAGKALHTVAKAKNESGYGAQWAGVNAYQSRPMPAAALMVKLIAEMKE